MGIGDLAIGENGSKEDNNSMPKLSFHPLTPERWPDLERLFGARGACAGCWCMWWRLGRAEWNRGQGEGNRKAFRKIVRAGAEPGVLAYADGEPIGWCAIAPREQYPRLGSSRILQPVDEQPVWSVTCFFIARGFRRQGLSTELLKAAVAFARARGAKIVEGYPHETKKTTADAFVYAGLFSAFRKAGFKEVARRSETRPIMRTSF
jgi:GNAT superfamily N-acetyltransferase